MSQKVVEKVEAILGGETKAEGSMMAGSKCLKSCRVEQLILCGCIRQKQNWWVETGTHGASEF